METWFIILISLSISALIKLSFNLLTTKLSHNKLPPGPPTVPIISNLLWLLKTGEELELILRNLHTKYGPVVTLRIGSMPAIFVANRSLAHQALVQNGSIFADRPPASCSDKIINCNQHNISSAAYGPTWRLLRRNLTSEILHPSRVKSYSDARKWVLEILIERLKSHSKSGASVCVIDHLRYAMFCLLALMCFGDKLEEKQIKEIERVQRSFLLSFSRFQILNFWPSFGKILFRKRWEELFRIIQDKENVYIPLIRARKMAKQEKFNKGHEYEHVQIQSYVDTLLDLELSEEKRKLEESEIVALCSEFLDGGTDTTSTALQWILANLVKYPEIQEKLYKDIRDMLKDSNSYQEVREEDLQKMPYLKAVVLEGLRRHPPGHFVLPHAVTQDTVLNGYLVPKDGAVNFMVAEMGWDPEVWEDPMAFKPERFLRSDGEVSVFDITASREIKMMPFGAGRRVCPGYSLAMLHLEYFLANLVWNFEWSALHGDDVDLSEKQELTVVMKKPLQVHLSPRNIRVQND